MNYAEMTNEELSALKAEYAENLKNAVKKHSDKYEEYKAAMMEFVKSNIADGFDVGIEICEDEVVFKCWNEDEKTDGKYRHFQDVKVRINTEYPNGWENPGVKVARLATYSRDCENGDKWGIAYYKFLVKLAENLENILSAYESTIELVGLRESEQEMYTSRNKFNGVEYMIESREADVKKAEIRNRLSAGVEFNRKNRSCKYKIERVTAKCVFVREGWGSRRYDINDFVFGFLKGTYSFVSENA